MFYVPPMIRGGFVFVFGLVCITNLDWYVLSNCSNDLDEEERADCFVFIIFWMSCYYKCSVALSHSAVGWSAVCDCGIT